MQRPLEILEHLGPAPGPGRAQQDLGGVAIDPELGDLALQPDEIAVDELGEDVFAPVLVDLEAVEQGGIERGVAEADPVGLEAGRVERVAQDG